MPKNRFQFSDDFVLNNNNVGIGSSVPQERLDVVGGIVKGENLKVTGFSSFTTYEGFLNTNQNITESLTITSLSSSSLSNEVIVATGVTVTVSTVGLGTTTVGVGTTGTITNSVSTTSSIVSGQGNVDSLKVYNTFTVPVGGTTERPTAPRNGMLFFNRDFATIEFWDGNVWKQVDNTTRSGRGVFGGGKDSPVVSTIDYINISSQGNALDFGILTVARKQVSAFSSSTRGLWAGGYNPTLQNVIDYVTLASQGNAISFGSLTSTVGTRSTSSVSSSTRGLICGGYTQPAAVYTNTIDYVEIATIGNAVNFGQLTRAGQSFSGGVASSTRGVVAGRYGSPTTIAYPTIDYVTIASKGNAVDFGSLSQTRLPSGCSNSTRGTFAGGVNPTSVNTIDYITIASTGNAQSFGELTQARYGTASVSSSIRGVIGGGYIATDVNTLDFILISTTGNATTFGSLTNGRGYALGGCSDSHGGLGGY